MESMQLDVQVGWRRSGIGLWSASGCRLFCSLRQTPLRAATPLGLTTSAKLMPMTLEVRSEGAFLPVLSG